MNKPVAPGRIRWAVLCLALGASGLLPTVAEARAQRVEAIVQMLPGESGAAGKAAAAGVDVSRSSWSRSSWSTSWDK